MPLLGSCGSCLTVDSCIRPGYHPFSQPPKGMQREAQGVQGEPGWTPAVPTSGHPELGEANGTREATRSIHWALFPNCSLVNSRANRDIIYCKTGVCNTMRAKFYSVAQEAGFCLQDRMEILRK